MQVPGEDGKGLWRCVFPAKPEETDEEVMSDEWINAALPECMNAGPYPIVHRNMYDVHQRVAGSFRTGPHRARGRLRACQQSDWRHGHEQRLPGRDYARAEADRNFEGRRCRRLLDRYDRQRRLTAIEYVQAQSIANKKLLEEKDPLVRRERLDELRRINADPARHLDYVKRASLISMWEKSEQIEYGQYKQPTHVS